MADYCVDQRGTVDFIIKKYPNGPMSTHLHDMEPGQRLEIKGPIPKYEWHANKCVFCSQKVVETWRAD